MGGFEDWYRAEHPAVLTAMIFMTGDVEEAREATAEAFSRALERWADVEAMANPAGWVYVVALNVVRRRWRRRTLERVLLRRAPSSPAASVLAETRLDVYRAVRSLPRRARTAVVLRYFGDLSEAEVAAAMNVAVGTASATLSAARRRLSVLLADYTTVEERP